MFTRIFEIIISVFVFFIILPIFFLIVLIIKLSSKGPVIHWSKRVGKDNQFFLMPKFRSMYVDTPQVATHLLNDKSYITPIGRFLRKSSLDELPQLLSVIKGDMSIVGPRPALFNQEDLIKLRTDKGVHALRPGITGWAQINGRDELPIPVKVEFDEYYLKNRNLFFDLKIIFLTIWKVLKKDGIVH